MKMRIVSVTVGLVSVLALAACKSSSSSSSGGAGAVGGTGGVPATGGTGGTGTGGSGPDCTCACTTTHANGGCGDICNDSLNGTNPPQPNYCNASPALTQCTACLMSNCNFSASDIANDMACM